VTPVDQSHPVVSVSVDGLHHPASVRHRQGRHSPKGFGLTPTTTNVCTLMYSNRSSPMDHVVTAPSMATAADVIVNQPYQVAPLDTVLIVEGICLHRDELMDEWDLTVNSEASN
jgi:uridine kinase